MIKSQKNGWAMIYVTTPCEKNATIICQEFAIPRPLENCKDETNPCNQVG
jgi:hypothetical protein